jgi:DNA-directed RNA polymerase specialized sigma24 family protein
VEPSDGDSGAAGDDSFVDFADRATGPLSRALIGAFGPEIGRDAALEALAWGWEHWDRLARMKNPTGYLFRVGQSVARRSIRRAKRIDVRVLDDLDPIHHDHPADIELSRGIERLSPRQRAAVLLVVGYGVPLREAASSLDCSVSTLRNHVDRALRHLREQLGASDDGR